MAGQDGVAPAEKKMKKNVGCAKIKRKQENSDHSIVDVVPKLGPSKKQRRKKEETEEKTEGQNAEEESVITKPDKKLQKTQRRKKDETANTEYLSINEEAGKSKGAKISKRKKNETKISKSEKTKKVEESIEVTDLIPRRLQLCSTSKKYVGAHVSIQGGLWNAALEAGRIGAKAFGLFLRSQRMWSGKPLEKSAAEKFRETCKEFGFDARFILPHSPYLMNLGSPKPDVRQKSRDMLVDELSRCHQLGLTLYNIHPGSHLGEMPVNKCLELIADGINHAHSQVPDITVVLENMSCQGSTVGGRFEELHGIINLVKDKTRIGVCLDTCHAFAAGKVGCRLDRHENIGQGHIGVMGFRQVMNEPRFNEIPMILETPYTADFDEIELLYSLCVEGATTKRNTKKPSSTIGPI
ncbi:probable endonuclease 4 isoform X2 [Rana temporaria]|uniref:probable endonuclease 4 isoform X2 n=1 Tax=Rana temporaria TaxID=8407 RepID=UPI001AAD37AC|nr:probable endonuclease 4 isoform X2 [Rana temporaria]